MIADLINSAALAEGFSLLGITPAVEPSGYSEMLRWIDDGFAADMHYFQDRKDAYRHPDAVLPGVRSLIMLAYPYASAPTPPNDTNSLEAESLDGRASSDQHTADPTEPIAGHGRVARYAQLGVDYHDLLHGKLKRLCKTIDTQEPESKSRGVVDTAPLMEREFAQLAGLGWIGKNTLLLNQKQGSYFFLACVLTSLELPYHSAHATAHCGTCTACLDACPTQAFPEPGRLDARRCISYLTIEHREAIPQDLRHGIGDWVFGCDICQEVCPWNHKSIRNSQRGEVPIDQNLGRNQVESAGQPNPDPDERVSQIKNEKQASSRNPETLELESLLSLNDEDFRKHFRKTPMWRPRRRGLLRNAAIVLGNQQNPRSIPALSGGLKDPEAIVRGACAWALGQYKTSSVKQCLEACLQSEQDQLVRHEIRSALQGTISHDFDP